MAPTPGSRLGQLIDGYKRSHSASDSGLATRIGIARQSLIQWRNGELTSLPKQDNLRAMAIEIGRPYRQVLSAALFDSGYLTDTESNAPRPHDEVLHDAISVLTEASRLTNHPMRQTSSGQWEADPDPRAALPIDWAAFVTDALAGAAANAGGIDTILSGRPGSWEASVIGDALRAAVGSDERDLWRHRTDPVTVALHPERILFDNDASNYLDEMDAAEAEITRRQNAIRPGHVYSGDADPQSLQWAIDLGYEIRAGNPPPPPTQEQIDAMIATATEDSPPLSPEEQSEEDALEALGTLQDRLAEQQRAELAEYGNRLADAVRVQLAPLQLPVPVTVSVDLDAPWDQVSDTPTQGWTTGAIDAAIANAIAATPTPDALPGTLLERTEAFHPSHATDRPGE